MFIKCISILIIFSICFEVTTSNLCISLVLFLVQNKQKAKIKYQSISLILLYKCIGLHYVHLTCVPL